MSVRAVMRVPALCVPVQIFAKFVVALLVLHHVPPLATMLLRMLALCFLALLVCAARTCALRAGAVCLCRRLPRTALILLFIP